MKDTKVITNLLQEIWCSRGSILDKLWDVSSIVSTCKSEQRLLRAQNRVSSHWRYLNPPQKSFIMQSKFPLFRKVPGKVQHFCSEIWKSGVLQFLRIKILAIFIDKCLMWKCFSFSDPFKEICTSNKVVYVLMTTYHHNYQNVF